MRSSGLIKNQRVEKSKVALSRELRSNMTEAEKIFWESVRNRRYRGLKFRRQQVIDGFIVDFFCEALRLCVEIDGAVHESENAMEHDRARDDALSLNGLRIMRFSNDEVMSDIEGVLRRMPE